MKYMNAKKVPQLFVATGATKWGDPQNFPWTMGWQPNYQSEGRIYAAYILENFPNGKIAALWQNDDAGKDQMKGLTRWPRRQGRHDHHPTSLTRSPIPPSISQIVALQRFRRRHHDDSWAAPKGAAQAIRKVAELELEAGLFHPATSATSVASVLKPAGLRDIRKDIISTAYLKDPTDPICGRTIRASRPGVPSWTSIIPDGDKTNINNVYGYASRRPWLQVLKQCGDNLTRENVMKQAAQPEGFYQRRDCCPASRSTPGRNDYLPDRTDAADEVQRRSLGSVRRHHHRRGGALRMRHHSVVPLLDRHYPGISGSTRDASWASDCCQPR